MAKRQDPDRRAGFLFIGGKALTIEDLGPAADMRLDQAMQYIVDNGLVGEFPPGTEWHTVLDHKSFNLVGAPKSEEEILLQALWDDLKAFEATVLEKDVITDEDRAGVTDRLNRYEMAKKLST